MSDNSPEFQLGLIGHPVAHSRSPRLHEKMLELAGLRGSYRLIDLEVPELAEFFSRTAGEHNLSGVNVTIPHKVAVMSYISALDPLARATGAVNTIRFEEDGTCTGYNTDIYGFGRSLGESYGGDGRGAFVYGYGGAARAVLISLIERGFKDIYLSGRDIDKLKSFHREFAEELFRQRPCDTRLRLFQSGEVEADLLVNCAPVGQSKSSVGADAVDFPDSLTVMMEALKGGGDKGFVFDLVYQTYRSSSTAVLEMAKGMGLNGIDGFDMLIYQAMKSFSLWTGCEVDASLLKRELAKK